MNKTDSDKLAAIHRSAEINKLEIENMIDIFETVSYTHLRAHET